MVPNTTRAHAAFSRAHFRRASMMTSHLRSLMLPVASPTMAVVNVHIMAAKASGMRMTDTKVLRRRLGTSSQHIDPDRFPAHRDCLADMDLMQSPKPAR